MRQVIIRRLLATGLPLALMAAQPSACAVRVPASTRQLLYTDWCTWEKEHPDAVWERQLYLDSAAECEEYAESLKQWTVNLAVGGPRRVEPPKPGVVYFGEVDDTDLESLFALPTESCDCGDIMTRVGWVNSEFPEFRVCIVVSAFACTAPGPGCEWTSRLEWQWDVQTTSECRALAKECGHAYYGDGGLEEALQTPEGECVCGESRAGWFFDWVPPSMTSDYSGSHCGVVRYQCLKRRAYEWPPRLRPVESNEME